MNTYAEVWKLKVLVLLISYNALYGKSKVHKIITNFQNISQVLVNIWCKESQLNLY